MPSSNFVPLEWRTHLIKPIFKSGDRNNIRNYRPISLLCVVSKILERIVYNHLIDFVNTSVSNHQFGFLRKRSTLQQLLILTNTIADSLNRNVQTDVVYLDFRKAFDSVTHNELLYKLWSFGITDSMWSWFRAYLSGRMQCVYINSALSDFLPVFSGVPQGSILGPLLFLIFMNDLPLSAIYSKLLLFADDAKCFMSITSLADCFALQKDLNNLAVWCTTWNLTFNKDKCSVVQFQTKKSTIGFDYLIGKSVIPTKTSHRDLGVFISATLQWKCHYQHILSKSYKMLGLLRRTFSEIHCSRAKRILYLSLIRSQLLYCSPLWRPHLLSDIKCLEDVQRRSTKFILRDSSLSYRDRLLKLNLLPLMMEFEISDIIFFVKSVKQPSIHFRISDFITFSSSRTRSSTYLKLRHSTALFIIVISTIYRDCGTLSHALILISQFQQ